jgi:hypothetical protein
MQRDVILVLGMHRGGTSSVAAVLGKLGAAAPTDFMRGDEFNEKGYWESINLAYFHDTLLAAAGSSWDDWRRIKAKFYTAPAIEALKQTARAHFLFSFGDAPLIVLKDPRICRFVPFWVDLICELKLRLTVVIPVRSPLEVAMSLRSRNGFSLSKGLLLWLRHMLEAEAASRDIPRSIISWDELLANWRPCAEKISSDLNIKWPSFSVRSGQDLDEFLTLTLKHNYATEADLAQAPEMHDWIKDTFGALVALARDSQSRAARATLDRVRSAFENTCVLYGNAIPSFDDISRELQEELVAVRMDWQRLHSEAEGLQNALQVATGRMSDAESKLEMVQKENQRLMANLNHERIDLERKRGT